MQSIMPWRRLGARRLAAGLLVLALVQALLIPGAIAEEITPPDLTEATTDGSPSTPTDDESLDTDATPADNDADALSTAPTLSSVQANGAPPTLTGATVNSDTLTLTYDTALDEASVPEASDFVAFVDANLVAVKGVSISGNVVTLTLAARTHAGASVNVSYTPGANPVQSATGQPVEALSWKPVTNSTVSADTTPPKFLSGTINRDVLTLTFDEPLNESVATPGAAFEVSFGPGSTHATGQSVEIQGDTVTVTLDRSAAEDSVVRFTYHYDNVDGHPLEDLAGNDVARIFGQEVDNVTDLTPPALTGAVVNGATLLLIYDDGPVTYSVPVADDYTVTVDGRSVEVSSVALSGAVLKLTLSTPVTGDAVVTLDYKPGTTPLRDEAGNLASELDGEAVADGWPVGGVLRVGPGQPYPTIESAMTVAAAGNIIEVHDGTYTIAQTLYITQENLTIRSANGPDTVTITVAAGTGIRVDASNVTISGLNLTPADGVDIDSMILITNTAATVQDNVIVGAGQTAYAIHVLFGYTGALTISGNSISGSSIGISVDGVGTGFSPNTNVVHITGNTVGDPTFTTLSSTGIFVYAIDWDTTLVIADNTLPFNRQGIGVGPIGQNVSVHYGEPDYAGPVVTVQGNTITRNEVGIRQHAWWYEGSVVTISENQVLDSEYDGFHTNYGGAGTVRIVGNQFSGSAMGSGLHLQFTSFDPTAMWTIEQNSITNNGWDGIYLSSHADRDLPLSVVQNVITGNRVGLSLTDPRGVTVLRNEFGGSSLGEIILMGMPRPAQIAYNQFQNGTIHNHSGSPTTVDMSMNWWGAATGPAEGQVVGDVTFSPWISGLTWTPGSLSVRPGRSQLVKAAFTTLYSKGNEGSELLDFSMWRLVSSAPAHASVAADGRVTGASVGTATISTGLPFDPGLAVTVTAPPSTGGDSGPAPALYVTISAPVTETREASITVSGTANPGAVVSVGGSSVTASAAGTWSATVTLEEGANTITATNGSASASITITRDSTPPTGTLPTSPFVTEVNPIIDAEVEFGGWNLRLPAGFVDGIVRLTITPAQDDPAVSQVAAIAGVAGAVEFTVQDQTSGRDVRTFKKKLTITFHYDPAQFPDPSRLAIYWHDPVNNVWVNIGGVVDPVAGTITAEVDHFTLFAVLAPTETVPMLDPVPTMTEEQQITVTGQAEAGSTVSLVLNGAEAATGTADDSGAYSLTTVLQEGRNLLYVKGSGLLASKEAVITYTPPAKTGTEGVLLTDIEGHWAKTAIMSLVQQGIISGFEDQTYRPELAISRVEFTVLVARALGLEGRTDVSRFTDAADIPAWARANVAAAVAAGIAQGRADGSFDPNAFITRAEAAVMLARAIQYKGISVAGKAPALHDFAEVPEWAQASVQTAANSGIITGYPDGTFRPGDLTTRAQVAVMLSRLLTAK